MNVDHHKQAPQKQQQQPKVPEGDNAAVVYKSSIKEDPAKVDYPPFLPVGNTQGIYKK